MNHPEQPFRPAYEAREPLHQPRDDLRFAIDFAQAAGNYLVEARSTAHATKKLDRTDVTDIDIAINQWFIDAIKAHAGEDAAVIGEELSALTEHSNEVWVIDPLDGTGEYIDDTIPDNERTSCVGIAKFKNWQLQLAVVCNPFQNKLFAADREFGNAFLNGEILNLTHTEAGLLTFEPGIPYDYCHWDGAPTDARFFESILGRPPLNSYSAINQACDVATGKSAFAVFPGNTIHDIAPSASMVELAGGKVSDIFGQPLDWQNLSGAIYAANPHILENVVHELHKAR